MRYQFVRRAARSLAQQAAAQFKLSVATFALVFRLTFPIVLGLRILEQFAPVLEILGGWLTPVMQLVGLPGHTGISWAAAIVVQPLAGWALLVENWSAQPLTVAQATIFAVLVLEMHAIAVEARLAQHLGMRVWAAVALRFGAAVALGLILHHVYATMNWLQQPAQLLVGQLPGGTASWSGWLLGQARIWMVFFAAIFALNMLMHYLRAWQIERVFVWLLAPLLRLLGIHRSAAMVAIIGLVLGVTFGAALLLAEKQSGRIDRRDLFLTVAMLCICHSVIEDTLYALLFGAHLSGVLLARVAFTIAVIAALSRLPAKFSERWLMTPAPRPSIA